MTPRAMSLSNNFLLAEMEPVYFMLLPFRVPLPVELLPDKAADCVCQSPWVRVSCCSHCVQFQVATAMLRLEAIGVHGGANPCAAGEGGSISRRRLTRMWLHS